ncbi:MAG: T9SS type A sorting domain-containing protein [Bacteroidales bacterium]|nr:T9SS type A sorting domain-containing protein [Bacteroidales bacterium]
MKRISSMFVFLALSLCISAQSGDQFSWRYYTPGNTGIMGDYSEALWIDHDDDPYIAAYTPGWEEGGFSKFLQSENQWINYSNVTYPVIGSIYDVGSSRISDIVEDAGGILWMATWRGILKFDPAIGGSSLEFWGAGNSPHPGGRTKDLDIAPDGSVWAVVLSVEWGGGGLVRYDPSTGEWQTWGYGSTANNWPELIGFCEHVSIQVKPGGGYVVWVDGEGWNTMITFDSETQQFTLLPQEYANGEVVSLPGNDCIDDEGNLWALRVTLPGEPFSLDYRQPDGTWVTPEQPESVIADIWAFKAFGNHEALITGLQSEIFQFNGNNWQSKGIWREGAYTSALAMDSGGNIWVSGTGGAARRDANTGSWQRYRVTNSSQIDYWVDDMSIDSDGNVWMTGNAGSGIGGFQMFDGVRWTGFNEYNYGLGYPFPFPTDNTEAICYRPSNGGIVVNPMFNYLHNWDGAGYTSLNYNRDRSNGLIEDSGGRLWSIGEYYSLAYYNDESGEWTDMEFISWGQNIRSDPERPSTIWAASLHQVMRTDGNYIFSRLVEDFPELNPMSDVFSAVIPGEEGIAWLGSNYGLFRIDAETGSYEYFSPLNSNIPGSSITPLAYTPDGRIWFSTFDGQSLEGTGLGWFDGQEFGFFPIEEGGLTHSQIKDAEVKIIPGGYELWMSCLSRGVAVLTNLTEPVGTSDIELAESNLHLKNYPNPFTDKTSVSFTLPADGYIAIDIFDINGRIVMNLTNSFYKAGTSAVVWNGDDNSGNRVKPGIYVCRLISGKKSQTFRLMVR